MHKTMIITAVALFFGVGAANAAPCADMDEAVATMNDKSACEIDTLNYGKGPSKPLGPRGSGGGVITYDEDESNFWDRLMSWFRAD